MSGGVKLLLLGVAIVVVIVLVLLSTFKVKEYEQVILLQFGEPRKVVNVSGSREPGLYLKTPFVQNVETFDKRILYYDAPAEEIILGDQKRLVVDSYLRYRITNPLKFFQRVGSESIARQRLGAILNAATREVLGRVELITVMSGERAQLMRLILDQVNRQSEDFGVDVIDVRIRRADLPVENSQAVYRRMQTERDREAKEFRAQGDEAKQRIMSRADKEKTILLANAKREAEIIRGQGDAQAVKIFADAFGKDEEFFAFYRSMQAYSQALGADDTTLVLSPDSEFFRFFGRIFDEDEDGSRR
jgi:membrane protease subunit HflC